MPTITLQIGNSDDRLPQVRWHEYVEAVRNLVELDPGLAVHFFGAPPNWAPWQNAAWVFTAEADALPVLREQLAVLRKRFDQQALSWTEGETTFL